MLIHRHTGMPWTECQCPQNSYVDTLNLKCDEIWRSSLWEVITVESKYISSSSSQFIALSSAKQFLLK